MIPTRPTKKPKKASPSLFSAPPAIRNVQLVFLAVSAALFVLACALPALHFAQDKPESFPGAQLLAMGWMGVFIGQFGWFANVLQCIALLLFVFHRWLFALLANLLSLALATHTFALVHQRIPQNEAATSYYGPVSFGPAVYLWLCSFALIGIATIALWWISRSHGSKNETSLSS